MRGVALWATAAVAVALHALAPRLPMVDLPQHAAQVALWRDLILGTSAWDDVVRLNLVTPYLAGYGLALPLSFVLPASRAVTVVLAGSMAAFVAASVGLRREVGADPRLDWLIVPAFLGYAWAWGFYTFLVVSPLVVGLIWASWRHARAPSGPRGAAVVGLGLLLLAGHGLSFLFAGAIGGALSLRERRWAALWPSVALGVAFALFFLSTSRFGAPGSPVDFGDALPRRALLSVAYATGYEPVFLPITAALLVAPLAMGLRPSLRGALPVGAVLAVLALVPEFALSTGKLWERFALYLLPFWALLFPARLPGRWYGEALAVAACWAAIGVHAARIVAFAREEEGFGQVMAAAEPGRRALNLLEDRGSVAAAHSTAYLHHPLWYQADRGGFVDFNFAVYHPQVVRFRDDRTPAVVQGFDKQRPPFDWEDHEGRVYDYFFVRGPEPAALLANPDCAITLVARSGSWALYERSTCRDR